MAPTLTLEFRLVILFLTLIGWLVIYFSINRFTNKSKDFVKMNLALDAKIPFIPQFAFVYFSTYLFIVQPFLILNKAAQFYGMLVSFATISMVASIIHATLPSKIDRIDIENPTNLSGKLLGLFQKTCRPFGNFPSMHVGLSIPVVVMNYVVGGTLLGGISLSWAVLIALSTLFTKQHYILDVLAGVFIGLVTLTLTYKIMPW
ncbi:MAG: phosphatase PAP2 family protein [Chloroflexota bacterium]